MSLKKREFSVTQRVLFALFITMAALYVFIPSSADPRSEAEIQASHRRSAETITRRCAVEAGINPDDGKHKITKEEMIVLTKCADTYK